MSGAPCEKKVLIVDDDRDIRQVLRTILSYEGYSVVSASNGEEAIRRLRTDGETCVILLDLMMPVMDGWRFRQEQRQDPDLADIPVVVISAAANVPQKAAELEAAGYIQKPIDFDDLLNTIERYCG